MAAVRSLAQRVRLMFQSGQGSITVSGLIEEARRKVFPGRSQRGPEYAVPQSEIAAFLVSCRQIFWGMAVFSGLSNILMLTGSFFMLQVYDRVLPSRSIPTLLALLALAIVLYVFQGALDFIRNRVSVRTGRYLDETLGTRVFDAVVRLPLKTRGDGDGMQPLRDLDQVRSFLSSGGPSALFDLPWMPVYIGICFLFHFWIGVTALVGALILISLTIVTEVRTAGPAKASARLAVTRSALASEGRRNAEVLHAMGMRGRAALRWREANRTYLAAHEAASDVVSGLGGVSKVFRAILQSLVLAVGAYLVVNQESTAGIIIASCAPSRIASGRPMKSVFSKCRIAAFGKSPTPPNCFSASATKSRRVLRFLPASRARDPCSSKCRRWSLPLRWVRRAAPWSAGTVHGLP